MAELNAKYQQIDYARDLYENGFDFSNNYSWFYPMLLLTIYVRDYEDMKPKKREQFLYEYIEKYKPDYNKVIDYQNIDKILSLAKNKNKMLRQIETIVITKAEQEHILSLSEVERERKILFSFLCAYKIDVAKSQTEKKSYIVSDSTMSFKQIKNFSNITLKKTERIEDIIREFIQRGLVNITKKTNIDAFFIGEIDNEVENNEVVYELVSFENFGYQWEKINGEKLVVICEDCDNIFKAKKNTKKLPKVCSNCGLIRTREKHQDSDRRRYLEKKETEKT